MLITPGSSSSPCTQQQLQRQVAAGSQAGAVVSFKRSQLKSLFLASGPFQEAPLRAAPHPPCLKHADPRAQGRCLGQASAALAWLGLLSSLSPCPSPAPACPCLAGSLLPWRSPPRSRHHRHSRVDGDGCVSCRDSPSSSPFSFHSNSWRKKQPNHQSLKNPSLPLLSSPNIAAWCRSSTTRTG